MRERSKAGALWVSAPTGNSIFSSPAVANGVVYVGSDDDKLYAFDLSSVPLRPGRPSPGRLRPDPHLTQRS